MSHSLPQDLLDSLERIEGFDIDAFVSVHQSNQQVTSIRLNPAKPFNMADASFNIQHQIPWSSHGFYLDKRPSFTTDPLFHAGAYYVQEASSMFLEQVITQTVDLTASIKVLDLCAAPGGKSTLIQSLLSSDSFLVSNEVIKSRVNILQENTTKWGAANMVVTNNDPRDFQRLPSYFDVIVVDAPCSGSGLFRKDNEAISEWSTDNVALCSQRQQRILSDIFSALKPGGILIYSTCSYSKAENEEVVDWMMETNAVESLSISCSADWGIKEIKSKGFGYQFYPHLLNGEGFFISAFKKSSSDAHAEKTNIKDKKNHIKSKANSYNLLDTIAAKWLMQNLKLAYYNWKEDWIAMPMSLLDALPFLQQQLYLKKVGVNIGTIIRNELVPSHELAMSTIMSDQIPAVELTLDEALQMLRHQPFDIQTPMNGWVLMTYGKLPLGFVKAMPNRINNYYPRDWRILNK